MALSYFLEITGRISPSWPMCVLDAKKTAIKVLTNTSKNAVFTLSRCNMLVEISIVPSKFYTYGSDEEQPSEEGDEEHHYGGGVEEQPPGRDADDKATATVNTEDNDMNDDLEDVNDGVKKPAVISMEDDFDNGSTQGSIPDNHNVSQSASEVAQSTTVNTDNVAQSTLTLAQSITVNTDNVAHSTLTFSHSNTQIDAALANTALEWDGPYLSPQARHTFFPVL
jgi:hypothetical protein